ncbi:SigmaW regulon antibacterial [Stieleria maiorica]|uniref:SigmaW regulon antibacterial n=1 Tax=Stieleria maiorica TaxID=2795974 RepID=A0A5B9M4Q6_9BACT|nr:flotillin-like FloA family protein [Stieleria maiorica]QEF96032.1 SigmaW regulon antibacterial [Stieleria maiorica]
MPSRLQLVVAAALIVSVVAIALFWVLSKCGAYWVQAYMSGADITMKSLVVMYLLKLDLPMMVTAKIMCRQAGLRIDRQGGIRTADMQIHALAGGDVMNVVQAIIVAHQAGIDLDFDRAAAIDLAGRDVLQAVQTSVTPKVIHCPELGQGRKSLSAIAKNGVELLVSARVTVRTNLDQLIGGATEETIVARVGQAIVSAIGSSASHMDVLEMPLQISKAAMARGLDSNTAFAIVSIDIADIDVGENIGARLQRDQADAESRLGRARAEARRAEAVARAQQMLAKVAENRAHLVNAEAEVPRAIAAAFRSGQLRPKPRHPRSGVVRDQSPTGNAASDHKNSPARSAGTTPSAPDPFPRPREERDG